MQALAEGLIKHISTVRMEKNKEPELL